MLDSAIQIQPRAIGRAVLLCKRRDDVSAIDALRQSGCMRVLFPRGGPALDAVLINTAGGVTGGDRLAIAAQVGRGSALTLTTQTAERAYCAQRAETGRITTDLTVADDGSLKWLPQELILFNGCNLDRRLNVELAASATALLVETVVFGRTAMGEKLDDIQFRDRISIRRNGSPLYLDSISMAGNISAQLAGSAVAQGAGAMTSVVYIAPDAEAFLGRIRNILPTSGGVTLRAKDVLVVRLVAQDSFVLRQTLMPILECLAESPLPKTWRQ